MSSKIQQKSPLSWVLRSCCRGTQVRSMARLNWRSSLCQTMQKLKVRASDRSQAFTFITQLGKRTSSIKIAPVLFLSCSDRVIHCLAITSTNSAFGTWFHTRCWRSKIMSKTGLESRDTGTSLKTTTHLVIATLLSLRSTQIINS